MKLKPVLFIAVAILVIILATIILFNISIEKNSGIKVNPPETSQIDIAQKNTFLSKTSINFEYISDEQISTSLFSNKPTLNSDKKTMWWEELPTDASVSEFSEMYDVSVPIVDMSSQSILVSVCRKIEKLRVDETDYFSESSHHTTAIITFSEEYYENTLFFYSVARNSNKTGYIFVPSSIMSPCFIMEGEDEKYLGLCLYFLSEEQIK